MNDPSTQAGSKFASLGPLLLARKGSAKPAMRPQLGVMPQANVEPAESTIDQFGTTEDDLGWNDMGDDAPADLGADELAHGESIPGQPEVRRQQELLLNRIADANLAAFLAAQQTDSESRTTSGPGVRKAKPRRAASASLAPDDDARRAAFTLRLDGERHLRLRLASTVNGESAQNLVTRALDEFLARMPDIETLAAQVRRPATKA